MKVRYRPPGSWFGVVLRSSDFSWGKVAALGGTGGSLTFPAPDFGERCVCCDGHDVKTRAFDAGTDRLRVDPIPMPVCTECSTHVTLSTRASQLMAAGMFLGGGLGLFVTVEHHAPWLGVAGYALFAVMALCMVFQSIRRRRSAARGHYTGLEISCTAHQCAVRTNNPRLAKDLLERNRAHVVRTTQPS